MEPARDKIPTPVTTFWGVHNHANADATGSCLSPETGWWWWWTIWGSQYSKAM